ncbi:MAG: hypothetical protein QF371_07870, partial [Flavobacteriales bacterium]|nr:hypothetical protein [Flavobacteriales bacterium]
MSWFQRNKVDDIGVTDLRRLILGTANVVSLNSHSVYNASGDNDQFKFSQLVGVGIKSEIRGRSIGDLLKLKKWLSSANDIVMGYLSYEVKNLLESLESENLGQIDFPLFHFFI